MLKLRKILLCNSLYYLILLLSLIYFLITTIFIKYQSIYNPDDTVFEGILTKYNFDGNKLSYEINGQEKIIGTYYFKTIEEKNEYQHNFKLGIKLKITGILKEAINNTIPNTFNYKKYLYNNKIYYTIETSKIEITNNQENIFYQVKNAITNQINKCDKTKHYILTFVLGNKNYLDNDIYKNYQELGVSHLFAISGMHISLFATILLFILKKLKVSEDKRYIATMAFLVFYLFLTNFMPSVCRAVLFFSLLSLNKIFFTNIKTINIFILTLSVLIFINPFLIYDIGAQYSFLTSFGLVLTSDKLSDGNYLKSLLKVSFIAFLFSLPISANNFYDVNLMSVINNLVFVPLITFIVYPLSLLTLIFNFLEPILLIFVNILEYLSNFCSRFEISFLLPKINIFFWLIYYLILLLYVKNFKKKYLIIIIVLLIFNRYKNILDNNSYAYFLDVGQGDSTILISQRYQEVIMIDTGGKLEYVKELWQENNKKYQISDNTITFLKSLGIKKINLLLITHGDEDHMGECFNLINNIKINKVVFNHGKYNNLESNFIKTLKTKSIEYYQNMKEINFANTKLYFLNDKLYDNENDDSNVIYTEFNGIKFLLMGDAGIKVEEDILKKYNLKNIDILKIGHHGSKTSSSKIFIDKTNPRYSIISVGRNNKYNHPNQAVLDNLGKSKIYRTDKDGTIRFKIRKNKLAIKNIMMR